MRTTKLILGLALLGAVLFVGCQGETTSQTPPPAAAPEPAPAPATAIAVLQPREGLTLAGTVTFTETAGGVAIVGDVTGVEGDGLHGFHIHQNGDCSAPDFTSAGGHFNPAGVDHGGPEATPHHAGDLGNITIGEDGSGHLEWTSADLTVGAGPDSVVGRGVILHEGEDDLTTQPTGAAGARLACGVVELSH